MNDGYKELKMGRKHFVWGLIWVILSGIMIGSCFVDWEKENIWLLLMFAVVLIYGAYCCLEQVNWYIRYDEEGFEIRNMFRKIKRHSFGDIKSIRSLKKDSAILYMANPKGQYEIEPNIKGAEEFLRIVKEGIKKENN